MSSNFDWHAEDDKNWDNIQNEEPEKPSKHRRWLYFVLLLMLLATVVFVIFDRAKKRIDENTQSLLADVKSSHTLIQTAYANDDNELFYTFLFQLHLNQKDSLLLLLKPTTYVTIFSLYVSN